MLTIFVLLGTFLPVHPKALSRAEGAGLHGSKESWACCGRFRSAALADGPEKH